MELFISVSSTGKNEKALVDFFTKAGCTPSRVPTPGAEAYECANWNLDTLKKAMKVCKWESQGSKFFPSTAGGTAYFIQKIGGDELCVFTPDAGGVFYLEFSGY